MQPTQISIHSESINTANSTRVSKKITVCDGHQYLLLKQQFFNGHCNNNILAHNEVRFVGHINGCGRHTPNAEKLATILNLAKPKTKKDVHKLT
jgi:hypothetical protein